MSAVEFDTVEEASERWIEEGKTFKDALNSWLDVIYIEDRENRNPEPKETRCDMGEYVLARVIEMNKSGEFDKARELFPPDNDAMAEVFAGKITRTVSKVLALPDGRIAVRVGEYHDNDRQVYIIDGNRVKPVNDLITFGSSHDKKFIAKAYEDRIDITDGWDGPMVAKIDYPRNYGDAVAEAFPDLEINTKIFSGNRFQIESINVFGDGKRVLLCGHAGIFILGKGSAELLHPDFDTIEEKIEEGSDIDDDDDDEDDGKGFSVFLHYPNADLSPDDMYISLGSQDSTHIIFKQVKGKFVKYGSVEPRSSYPHRTKFNYLLRCGDEPYPQVALSSCHYSSSATVGLPLKNLVKGFSASGWDGDESLDFIDEVNWIFSIMPSGMGYFLGSNSGYIWIKAAAGAQQIGYIHIGGTIMDMDISSDRKTIYVASSLGQVVVLNWALKPKEEIDLDKNNRRDPFLVTNMPAVDMKRYLFLKGKEPLIW